MGIWETRSLLKQMSKLFFEMGVLVHSLFGQSEGGGRLFSEEGWGRERVQGEPVKSN